MSDKKFCVEYAKRGQAGCKECKVKIEKGCLRIAKLVPNPFSDSGGDMKQWYHVKCIFAQLSRARATTKRIEDPGDLDGWDDIEPEDRKTIMQHIKDTPQKKSTPSKAKKTPVKRSPPSTPTKSSPPPRKRSKSPAPSQSPSKVKEEQGKDGELRALRQLCCNIAEVGSYLEKTKIVANFFEKGATGKGFRGDLLQWVRLLLPGVQKKVYNLQSKQLIKLYSQIFDADEDDMLTDLEQGDIAETVRIFFEQSNSLSPQKKSSITLTEVENLLDELSQVTKEDEQTRVLRKMAKKCTGNDLKIIVRLIKHDLRINAGPKHILEAVHPNAYAAFQTSRDLKDVIQRVQSMKEKGEKDFDVKASIMTPVLPMLAEPCRSVEYAFKKCPNGIYAEIKYDGERVQVHHEGDSFRYFSRSLKPVMPHKVAHLKEFIPKAFPKVTDIILDSEILLIDTKTKKPLPFGTLGKHKKEQFHDASVCLFVFDCLHYNGENLMNKPFFERRKILEKHMTVIPNHVVFSEIIKIENKKELDDLIQDVISQGLEGLVLKDLKGIYEPGKRHWLKVKKDYLEKGAMADSADLVVLGAYFGTGNKGGMKSIFLMGCWNEDRKIWVTVSKVHGGHDDATLKKLQTELEMTKIGKDPNRVPNWLDINRTLVPDFISNDPKKSPVWEITGAEFSHADAHTADGISIRFPRVTKIRNDKDWKSATTLKELKELYKKSKTATDFKGIQTKKSAHGGENEESATEEDEDVEMKATPKKKDLHKKSKAATDFKGIQTKKRAHGSDNEESETEEDEDVEMKATPKKKAKQEPASPTISDDSPDKNSSRKVTNIVSGSFMKMFPKVFSNVVLYLSEDVDQYDVLKRYFIAYDGDLVADYEIDKATHIIVPPGKPSSDLGVLPSNANFLTSDWLLDSVKLQKIQNTKFYAAKT